MTAMPGARCSPPPFIADIQTQPKKSTPPLKLLHNERTFEKWEISICQLQVIYRVSHKRRPLVPILVVLSFSSSFLDTLYITCSLTFFLGGGVPEDEEYFGIVYL